jgi:hypothetical protein
MARTLETTPHHSNLFKTAPFGVHRYAAHVLPEGASRIRTAEKALLRYL